MTFYFFKSQIKLMLSRLGFKISFISMLILSLLNTCILAYQCIGVDKLFCVSSSQAFILNANSQLYSFLMLVYIFIAILPFGFSYSLDYKQNNINIIQSRTSIKSYYKINALICFLGAFLVMFIPLIIEIIINQLIFDGNGTFLDATIENSYNRTANITGDNVFVETIQKGIPFKNLFINYPQLYNVLYSVFFSLFCGVISVFTYSLSFILKKFNFLLFFPLYIITYILKSVDSVIGTYCDVYINVNISDYIGIQTFYGKSIIFIVSFILILILISFVVILRKTKKDQL